MTLSGIESAIFRLVAQCLNQLHHRVPLRDFKNGTVFEKQKLIACLISKTTNRHSEYVTIIAFPLRQWFLERASALRYTHIACIVDNLSLQAAGICFTPDTSVLFRKIDPSNTCTVRTCGSVMAFATGWSVRGSTSDGARISVSLHIGPGAYLASRTLSTESFPVVNLPGCGFDHPVHLAQKLKKE